MIGISTDGVALGHVHWNRNSAYSGGWRYPKITSGSTSEREKAYIRMKMETGTGDAYEIPDTRDLMSEAKARRGVWSGAWRAMRIADICLAAARSFVAIHIVEG